MTSFLGGEEQMRRLKAGSGEKGCYALRSTHRVPVHGFHRADFGARLGRKLALVVERAYDAAGTRQGAPSETSAKHVGPKKSVCFRRSSTEFML